MNAIKNLIPSMLKNQNELTLEYWEIHVCEGIEFAIRGRFYKITEIYVPELELTINKELKPLNIFQSKKDRYKLKNSDMCGTPAKLIKKVTITGEQVQTLRWIERTLKEGVIKKESLVDLFNE